jgi:hypothetical protein
MYFWNQLGLAEKIVTILYLISYKEMG